MPELILPGVFIEVRPEALIVPGAITVNNIGIVGTARRGPVGEVRVIGSYAEARDLYGGYDAFDAPTTTGNPLTLVRALELAYANGATTVLAIRITETEDTGDAENAIAGGKFTKARKAGHSVASTGGVALTLKAKTHGAWANDMKIAIADAAPNVIVTIRYSGVEEAYTVATGTELVNKINDLTAGSGLVSAVAGPQAAQKPSILNETNFKDGSNSDGAKDTDYGVGLDQLLNENAHIILAAGQTGSAINTKLLAHVEAASTDKIKRDRIAVTGSPLGAKLSDLINNGLGGSQNGRMVFVAPGIKTTDAQAQKPVTLSGAYSAAAVAGMLSARSAHISLTNKPVAVDGLETKFTPAQLEQLVSDPARVLALEDRQGIRVVKGITTSEGAFRQITTRRIVDYTKFGVRSAAAPYIGPLNNDRVRKALKGSINGFLAGMVDDEMLVSYELDVTATRDEEIRGIAKVILTVRPTFSIDFIKVTMFLG